MVKAGGFQPPKKATHDPIGGIIPSLYASVQDLDHIRRYYRPPLLIRPEIAFMVVGLNRARPAMACS